MNQFKSIHKNKVITTSNLSKKRRISSLLKALLLGGIFIPSIALADGNLSVSADGADATAVINEHDKTFSTIGLGLPDQSIYSPIYAIGTNGAGVDIKLNNVVITSNQMWHSGVKAVGSNINIDVSGVSSITTSHWQAHGIIAQVDNTLAAGTDVTVSIKNAANITQTDAAAGAGTHGIIVDDSSSAKTNIHIVNSGNINLVGYKDARGILINNSNETRDGFTSNIENSGNISVPNGIGILSQNNGTNTSATVTNTGNITIINNGRNDVDLTAIHGIELQSTDGIATINHLGGNIVLQSTSNAGSSTSSGLVAYGYYNPKYTEAYINVDGTATVDATMGGFGVEIIAQKGKIFIGQNASVMGGLRGAGLIGSSMGNALGTTANLELENQGTLGSANDHAIEANVANHEAIIKNTSTGKITGYITSTNKDKPVTFTNEGTWNLRNTYQSVDLKNGTYVKNTEAVSISNFGAQVSNLGGTITNSGKINLVARDQNLTLDSSKQYTPFGASTMEDGASHAQLLEVDQFTLSSNGIIDLTAGNTSTGGNVLVISGSKTAGTAGNGTFRTDGGSILFNTVFNEGAANSKSDMLVVDNVELGSAPTEIFVNPVAGSTYVKTEGNGIRLIEVRGAKQDAGAFVLGEAVTYGLYEYQLNSVPNDGFYLTNQTIPTTPVNPDPQPDPQPTPDPEPNPNPNPSPDPVIPPVNPAVPVNPNLPQSCYFTNSCGWKNPNLTISPNVGAIIGGQTAATNMFSKLGRTFGHYNKSGRDRALWVTATGDQTKYTLFNGRLSNKINTGVLTIGSDILTNKDESLIFGLYVGMGQSKIKTTSRQTGTRSELDTKGYSIGGYLLINALKDEGFYMNTWAYYGQFKNKFKGASYNGYYRHGTKKYDSNVYSINTDFGYKIPLSKDTQSPWVLMPKVELYYTNYRGDAFTDYTTTTYAGNRQRGLQSSVGARLYMARLNPEDLGIKPYMEANWLHNTANNKLKVNYERISQKVGENAFEIKFGATGKLAKNFDIFGYIAGQKGSSSYKKLEGQLGFRYLF